MANAKSEEKEVGALQINVRHGDLYTTNAIL
jgi:hypothetical protein